MKKTDLEAIYREQIRLASMPPWQEQVQAISGRKFKWDFAWPEHRLLVEINGGTFMRGGHSTGTGIARDYEKGNLAAIECWFTMTFDSKQLKSGQALRWTQVYFKNRG